MDGMLYDKFLVVFSQFRYRIFPSPSHYRGSLLQFPPAICNMTPDITTTTTTETPRQTYMSTKMRAPSTHLHHATLPPHLPHHLGCQVALVRQAHLAGKRGVRDPLATVPGGGLFHHAIDLFQRQALGLGDEEIRVDPAAHAERAPDEEDLGTQVATIRVDHVGRNDGDDLDSSPVREG